MKTAPIAIGQENYAPLVNKLLLPFILITVVFVYLPATDNYFVGDDYFLIAHAAQNGFSFDSFLKPVTQHFQPVFRALFALEFYLFGTDAHGYHWVNILLHCANVYLAMILFTWLLSDRFLGLLTSLVFGISAAHWQVPTWITCQGQLLATFLFLISTLLFITYIRNQRTILLFLASLTHFIMLLSFSAGVEVPLLYVFLLYYFYYRTKSKSAILRHALVAIIPFIITIMLYFFLRNMLLPDMPRYSIVYNIGGLRGAFTNIPKAFSLMLGGIYTGYVQSFTGAYLYNTIKGTPYLFNPLIKTATFLPTIICTVCMLLFVDWSSQGIRKYSLMIGILMLWLLSMYFPPALFRQKFMNMYLFAGAARYRYLPCLPAAAIVVVLWKSLRPLSSHNTKNILKILLCLLFVFILYLNIAEIRTINTFVKKQSHEFQKTESIFIRDLHSLINMQQGQIQIIDRRFNDPKIRYAALFVRPSILARIHFSHAKLKDVRFVAPKDSSSIQSDIPIYEVTKGCLLRVDR